MADTRKPILKYYLVAFNLVSTFGWAYILLLTINHVFNLDGSASNASPTTPKTASSTLSDFLSAFSIFRSSGIISVSIESRLPAFLQPPYHRSTSTFARVGTQTAFIQTLAVLEVVHALLRWVRSPVQTTVMQVASRLFIVWGVMEQFVNVRTNPLYSSMVLAWSMTEVIRYSFYACNLFKIEPYFLLWLRYSTFYILYPIGASSEAFLIYATLPTSSPIPGWRAWANGMWKPADYVRALLFCVWWPSLYILYTYMIRQRRKILGGSKLGAAKAKGGKTN